MATMMEDTVLKTLAVAPRDDASTNSSRGDRINVAESKVMVINILDDLQGHQLLRCGRSDRNTSHRKHSNRYAAYDKTHKTLSIECCHS